MPGRSLHSVERRSYGDFLLAVAVGLVFVLSDGDPLLYVLPLAVLTLGDAAAALAGSSYGRNRFAVADGHKSLEGSAMLFLVTVILAMVCLLLLSDIARANVVILAFLIAGFGAMVEADSWRGLRQPVPAARRCWIVLDEHRADPAAHLLVTAGLFAVALIGFYGIADRLGAPRHVARVYLAAAFLLVSVTDLQNAVFPLAMLAVHLVAERRAPSGDAQPAARRGGGASRSSASAGLRWATPPGSTPSSSSARPWPGSCWRWPVWRLDGRGKPSRWVALALVAALIVPLWLWLMGANGPDQLWLPRPEGLLAAHARGSAGWVPLLFADRSAAPAHAAPLPAERAGAGPRLRRFRLHRSPRMTETFTDDGARVTLFAQAPSWEGAPTMALGRFACDTGAAGAAVLARAEAAARAAGAARLLGPMDGTTWNSYRLVTETDGTPPFLMEPTSGPADRAAFEAAGFAPVARYFSARVALDGMRNPPPVIEHLPRRGLGRHRPGDAFRPGLRPLAGRILAQCLLHADHPRRLPRDVHAFRAGPAPGVRAVRARPGRRAGGVPVRHPELRRRARARRGDPQDLCERRAGGGPGAGLGVSRPARAAGFSSAIHALIHETNASGRRSARLGAEVFRRYALMGKRLDDQPD